MKVFDVTQKFTHLLTHRILADTREDAIARMRDKDRKRGEFVATLYDETSIEYDAQFKFNDDRE